MSTSLSWWQSSCEGASRAPSTISAPPPQRSVNAALVCLRRTFKRLAVSSIASTHVIYNMSKRTFIDKWVPQPLHSNPVRRTLRSRHEDPPMRTEKERPSTNRDEVRWYGDPTQKVARTHFLPGRLTQKVGLFRNAKRSQIVVNEISSKVRRASNKQIGRLVAPDDSVTYQEDDADADQRTPCFGERYQSRSYNEDARNVAYTRRDFDSSVGYSAGFERDYGREKDSRMSVADRVSTGKSSREVYGLKYRRDDGSPGSERDSRRPSNMDSGYGDESDSTELDSMFRSNQSSSPLQQIKRYNNPIAVLAAQQCEKLVTPTRGRSTHPERSERRVPTLSGVAARVLSALPPIYLREDNADKYDTVALRLLGDSIQRNESAPGSGSNLLRSFLDRTDGIAAGEKSSQPGDNACEDVFRDGGYDIQGSPGAATGTPELERLFNHTIATLKPDNYFGTPNFADYPEKTFAHVSSMLTPTSIVSSANHRGSARIRSDSSSSGSPSPSRSSDFPFPRDYSPDSRSSDGEDMLNEDNEFHWELPTANGGIFDVVNGK
ncbi:hypothetical protein Q1695_007213 [Nippostrongylus brasiliensis]|nr:hypothetical protein Q1695_007213 [Nippostrongylus brasiliensis]